jgi:hypothetical protein
MARLFTRKSIRGFAYVSAVDDGPMQGATAGATVENTDGGPPWIVVDHAIESVVIARWPGRLWEVEVARAAATQASAHARYTRAVAVRVLREHPVENLFGAHGRDVCAVIETARRVTLEDVARLADAVHPRARAAYGAAWRRWLGSGGPGDHEDTLAAGDGRSAIGSGFTVLYGVLSERAHELTGDAAFVVDDEGNRSLTPVWAAATDAFLHAAMAFGTPELTPAADAELLKAAWSTLIHNED